MSGHDHQSHGAEGRRLGLAALLTGGFMLAEVVGGVLSGSLALIADAGHMLTDFAALALAWYGMRLAQRPADWRHTFGYDRFAVLVAFANGFALFAVAAWIVVEAAGRLVEPAPVLAGPMLAIAVLGLLVNIAAFALLHGGVSLNARAAALHVLGDLLGSVAAIAAALVIMGTGWTPVDPLLSVLVALLILRAAARVVAQSGRILLEGTPEGLDPRAVAADLETAVEGLDAVRHVHLWSISETRPMATLEAAPARGSDPAAVKAAIKARMAERHRIHHVTVEIDLSRREPA